MANNIYNRIYGWVVSKSNYLNDIKYKEQKIKMESKADKIKQLLEEIQKLMKQLNIPDEVLEREVSAFGNSAHITIPKKYINKKAIVIIRR